VVKYGRGVLLTTDPLPVPRSWKSRAIPLPTLWATTGPVTGTIYLYLFNYFLDLTYDTGGEGSDHDIQEVAISYVLDK
jgi:hypothetical protein